VDKNLGIDLAGTGPIGSASCPFKGGCFASLSTVRWFTPLRTVRFHRWKLPLVVLDMELGRDEERQP
jgi:hypothetical protein